MNSHPLNLNPKQTRNSLIPLHNQNRNTSMTSKMQRGAIRSVGNLTPNNMQQSLLKAPLFQRKIS